MDATERYCAWCHVFIDDVLDTPPKVRKAMAAVARKIAISYPDDRYRAERMERTAKAWEWGLS